VAEATYSTTTRVPIGAVWDFVQDMDHWGRFVTGYQKHEKHDDKHSSWTLKGDVGVLSRTLVFRVEIVEWNGPNRVAFTLTGVNEPMQGEGTFTMTTESGSDPKSAEEGDPKSGRRGFLFRWLESFWRWLLGRAGGGAPVRDAAATQSAAGDTRTRLDFALRLQPGGPMAPMIDAMIRPLMLPAAEDLANRILAELEQQQSSAS
jgi:carbon monoxide dehydrogenase subunit G